MQLNQKSSLIIIYDSSCLMCSNFVYYLDEIFKKDKINLYLTDDVFKVKKSKDLYSYLNNFDLDLLQELSKQTIIVIDNKGFHTRSKAILKIFEISKMNLKSICRILYTNKYIIFILDLIYRFIAMNRKLISKIFVNKNCNLYFRNITLL